MKTLVAKIFNEFASMPSLRPFDMLAFVSNKLVHEWNNLTSLNIVSIDSYYSKMIRHLSTTDFNILTKKNKFVRYALMVQPALSANDFIRIVDSCDDE